MKITKRTPPADQPRLLDAAEKVARDEAVAALIAAAPTPLEAWEALGERTKGPAEEARDARAQALADALLERWTAIKRGRALVEASGLQPGYAERFLELHTERLELRRRLDAEVFASAAVNRHRIASLCDAEVGDVLGAAWPNGRTQEAMETINTALLWVDLDEDEDPLPAACREAVAAACAQVYGDGGETT